MQTLACIFGCYLILFVYCVEVQIVHIPYAIRIDPVEESDCFDVGVGGLKICVFVKVVVALSDKIAANVDLEGDSIFVALGVSRGDFIFIGGRENV